MNVLLCDTANFPLETVADVLTGSPGVNLIGVARTGRDAIKTLNSEDVDISIHSRDTIELARLIRGGLNERVVSSLTRVVATESPDSAVLVKAHQLGFDGVVSVPPGPTELVTELRDVLTKRKTLSDHPMIKALNLDPGALARKLQFADEIDIGIADLLGTGLSDADIATAMRMSIQSVRNHIEELLNINALTSRTQLAVLRAIDLSIPDFA